ncbi:hypothetical protein EV126DRAFT_455252 [Verticillium dahliae]|nr:hypothetical protein EV126DRAFT_455252 [Verticillium dahliae]
MRLDAWLDSSPKGFTSDIPARKRYVVLIIPLVFVVVSLVMGFSRLQLIELSHPVSQEVHQMPPRTSKLHYLVPSSFVNDAVCAGIISALVNRYPIPTLIGYKGENEFDAVDHLAKVRVINRFLKTLPAEDDDLVIVVDSFDVLAQLPVEVTLERYFEMSARSEKQLADQRGITIDELHDLGIRQSILYGTGKICFDANPNEPLCPFVPGSNSAQQKFGVMTGGFSDPRYRDSRYLNSGTIMAPVGHLRKFMHAVQELVEADDVIVPLNVTSHGRFRHHMDQWFTATLYVRQEYHRALDMNGGKYPGNLTGVSDLPKPRKSANDTTEYHIFVDFDSSFTQTQCHNELEIHQLNYSNHDLTSSVTEDFMNEGKAFKPHALQMPASIYQAFGRVWDNLSHVPNITLVQQPRVWIQSLGLATNVASGSIHAFYHNTCSKAKFLETYKTFWFFPLVVPLLELAKMDRDDMRPLHSGLIDGRMWIAARDYPQSPSEPGHDVEETYLGGVFTDFAAEPFLNLPALCRENWTDSIGTQVHGGSR